MVYRFVAYILHVKGEQLADTLAFYLIYFV